MHRPPDRGPLLWAVPPTKNQRKTGELAVPGTTQPALPSGDVQAGPRCHARVEGPGLGEPLKHRPDWTGSRWPVCLWFALVLQPPRQARCSLCSNAWLAGVHAAAHIFLFAGALQAALRPQGPGKRQETRDVTGYENCMSALIFRSLCCWISRLAEICQGGGRGFESRRPLQSKLAGRRGCAHRPLLWHTVSAVTRTKFERNRVTLWGRMGPSLGLGHLAGRRSSSGRSSKPSRRPPGSSHSLFERS